MDLQQPVDEVEPVELEPRGVLAFWRMVAENWMGLLRAGPHVASRIAPQAALPRRDQPFNDGGRRCMRLVPEGHRNVSRGGAMPGRR